MGTANGQATLQAPTVGFPLQCTVGWNCWIQSYVNHTPEAGVTDYQCGIRSSPRHKGTDIMIRNQQEMQRGVSVVAAAAGTVIAVRDSLRDVDYRTRPLDDIRNQECGNGVRIDHGQGWFSQYCHMRKNSITLAPGDKVEQGTSLGFVGMSGKASVPHLHFQVDFTDAESGERMIVDPFVGLTRSNNCGVGGRPLWHPSVASKLDYKTIELVDMGFATTAPTPEGLNKGLYDDKTLSVRAPYLFVWARGLYLEEDDHISFTITDPDGSEILNYTNELSEDQALGTLFSGIERPSVVWEAGTYTGRLEITRFTLEGNGGRFQFESRVELK